MDIEYRAARPEEIDEVSDHCSLVFNGGRNWFYNIITRDPWRSLDNTRVALVDGRIVGNVQVHRRPVRYGAAQVIVGGIGHVSTHPDFRKHGIANRLLNDAIAVMERDGYHLSLLYTGINGFYARLGWRDWPLTDQRLELPFAGRIGQGAYDVTPSRIPVEAPDTLAIYDACAPRWIGMLARVPDYWAANPSWTEGEFLQEDHGASAVATRNGKVCGYLRGRIVNAGADRASIDEVCWLPDHGPCALDLVDRFVAAATEAGKQYVDFHVGEEHPAVEALGGVARLAPLSDTSPMFRVIDGPGLLEAAGPELLRRLRCAGRDRLAPLSIDYELGALRLAAEAGTVSSAPYAGQSDATLTEDAFLRLVLGRTAAADLAQDGALSWAGADRTEDLAALFPRQPYNYVRYDKF